MSKLFLTLCALLLIVVPLVVIVSGSKNQQNNQPIKESLVFYYGITCPHCKDVEEFINTNNIHDKVEFTEKEVYENKENSDELSKVAQSCGIPLNQIFVPFLYDNGECIIGSDKIIANLANKAGIEATSSAVPVELEASGSAEVQ
jgi:glutaredoxin